MTKITNQTTQAEYFYDALVSKFPGLASDIFQFATTPIPATWVDGNESSVYSNASRTSTNVSGFYVPGTNFYNSYASLVNSLKVSNANKDPNYLTTLRDYNNLQAIYTTELQSAQAAYSTWKSLNSDGSGNAPPFPTWLNSVNGFQYNSKLNNIQGQMTALQSNLTRITKELKSPYAVASENLTKDQITVTFPNGAPQKLPRFGISGNLANDKINWDTAPKGQYALDITITGNETIKHPWKILYTQCVEEHCLNFSTKNAVNTSRIIQDEHYSLNFKAVGAESYPIEMGTWYDPTVVNPDIPIEPGGDFNSASFFGLNGPLHLVPSAFFVLYKPTMTLTVTTTTYEQYIKGKASASVNWLNIFGIRFDVSQGSGIIEKSGADDDDDYNADPRSEHPANYWAAVKEHVPGAIGVSRTGIFT